MYICCVPGAGLRALCRVIYLLLKTTRGRIIIPILWMRKLRALVEQLFSLAHWLRGWTRSQLLPLLASDFDCVQRISYIHLCVCERASLVAQMVKKLPAVRETWLPSLGQDDPLEKGTCCVLLFSRSVLSDSVTPWTLLSRLLCPWDIPVKNTGVGCNFLLQGVFQPRGGTRGLLHCRWILYHWVASTYGLPW